MIENKNVRVVVEDAVIGKKPESVMRANIKSQLKAKKLL